MRGGERGLLKGLVLALMGLLVVVLALGGYALWRMSADPDLGPPPQGPAHGRTEAELAAYALGQLAPLISPVGGSEHATVTLTEQDLTTIVRQNASDDFANPTARIRDGRVVVSGDASVDGVHVTGVGRMGLRLDRGADGDQDVAASIEEIDAGRLTLPWFLRDAIAGQVQQRVQLDRLLEVDPRLALLRPELECVAVAPAGVVLGFHRPLAESDAGACTR